jgi:A/G-specific adenine glycosylase
MKWFPLWTEMCFGIVCYFDVETDIGFSAEFAALAFELMPRQSCYQPGDYGVRCCNANCGVCVFNDSCAAQKVDQLPVKSKKLKVRNRLIIWLFLTRMKTP